MNVLFLLLMMASTQGPAAPSGADQPRTERDPRYDDCIALLDEDKDIGRIAARQWFADGGGAAALHCLALADLAAGYPKLAALRLEELAKRHDAGDHAVRARILSQSAQAWLEAEETTHAEQAIEAAFAQAPEAVELELTAAKVYAANERWQAVVDAVTRAENAGFAEIETYILRAKGYMALTNFHAAAEDIVRALKIDPFDIDALVLRGELKQRGIVINANYRRVDGAEN